MSKPDRRPYSNNLARVDVVEAAVALVDEIGHEALTMRGLASRLGVSVMSLYTYVQTKEDLLAQVASWHLGRLDLPHWPRSGWEDALVATFLRLHDLMVEHPVLAQVATSQPLDTTESRRFTEHVLAVLVANGYSVDAAVELFIGLGSLTGGYVLNEVARTRAPNPPPERARVLQQLDPGEFPTLVAAAMPMVEWRSTSLRSALARLINTAPRSL